jgi:hypothetical protein
LLLLLSERELIALLLLSAASGGTAVVSLHRIMNSFTSGLQKQKT